jgi:SHS2 domain-containing protein
MGDVSSQGDRSAGVGRPGHGHRSAPAGTGRVIEAWGPDAAACLTEALVALVEGFCEIGDAPAARVLPLSVAQGPEDALTSLIEEVLDAMGAFSVVPVRFHLTATEDGGFAGDMEVVPVGAVSLVRRPPTAVSFDGLSMAGDERGWRCRVRVDA